MKSDSIRIRARHLIWSMSGFLFTTSVCAAATTHFVALTGSDGQSGESASPWRTIQHAVTNAAVADGDTIAVGGGLYEEAVVFLAGGRKGLSIKGGYDPSDWSWAPAAHPTIVRPASAAQDVVSIHTPLNSLIGLTLTGGKRGVYAKFGAGLNNGILALDQCIVSNNASHGLFHDNGSSWNGVTIRNGLIVGNGGDGVKVDQDWTTPFYNFIVNTTIANNGGSGYLGGNYYQRSTYIVNCIIAFNGEYGIRRWNRSFQSATTVDYTASTCLYGNSAGNISSAWHPFPWQRTLRGVFSADPLFVGNGDYRLLDGSPCVDATVANGLPVPAVTVDLDNADRTGVYDLGCHESAWSAPTRHAVTYADAAQADDSGDGTTSETAKRTINAALAVTAAGGTCFVAAGTYAEEVFLPAANLTLQGDASGGAVIDAPGDHVVMMLDTNITVRNLTLQGGERGVMLGENAGRGGRVENCVIRNNRYGVHSVEATTDTQREVLLDRCIVTNNLSHALYFESGSQGGLPGAVSARNCLIAGNGGNGIYANVAHQTPFISRFEHCTIAGNGGSGFEDFSQYSQSFEFSHSIIAGNGGYGVRRSWTGGGYLVTLRNVCLFGNALGHVSSLRHDDPRVLFDGGVFVGDPLFAGVGDYRLSSGSPALKQGSLLAAVAADITGAARADPADLGCYESVDNAATQYSQTFADAVQTDDSGDGTTPATAKRTINAALAVTAPGGVCTIAPGVYDDEIIITRAKVTLAGGGAAQTTIQGGTGRTVLTLAAAAVCARDVTVLGASRGILVSGVDGTTNILVEACRVTGSTNGVVAPKDTWRRSYTLDRCAITNNTGYGVWHIGDNTTALTADNCLIANNALDGLHLAINWFAPRASCISHCTLAENKGSGYRADNAYQSMVYFTNCVVSANEQYGIRKGGTTPASQRNYVAYSCVHDNGTGDFFGAAILQGDGLITNRPPLFRPGGYTLSSASPCVDSGYDLGLPTDLTGAPRMQGPGPDMGAFEYPWKPKGTLFLMR